MQPNESSLFMALSQMMSRFVCGLKFEGQNTVSLGCRQKDVRLRSIQLQRSALWSVNIFLVFW